MLFKQTNRRRSLFVREMTSFKDVSMIIGIILMIAGLLTAWHAYLSLEVNLLAAAGLSTMIIGLTGFSISRSSKSSHESEANKFKKKEKRFLATLAVVLVSADVLVSIADRTALISVYFIANVLAYNLVALAFDNEIGERAMKVLKAVAAFLFIAFICLVVYKINMMLKLP